MERHASFVWAVSSPLGLNTFLPRGIRHLIPVDFRERREAMFLGGTRMDHVEHTDPSHEERIRQQGPMAFPRDCLRTHDCGSRVLRLFDESIQGQNEFRRAHVVGISAEAGITPTLVPAAVDRFSIAPEVHDVLVGHSSFGKCNREVLLGSPGNAP